MEDMSKKRPISANDVADWFINQVDRQAADCVTPLEIQRLVFFAQAWYLANNGRAMFKEDFEAWATGPVEPSIFMRFEHLASSSIPEIEGAREIGGDRLEVLKSVQDQYGCYKNRKLAELSREPGGPWENARRGLAPEAASSAVITKEAMKKFYGEKIQKSWS